MCPQETKKGRYQQPNKSGPKKPTANSKVVCVKFSAQTLDEKFLKSLIEPFGKMVKVIMFPSLAYVEMGSSDQAKDLVTYYSSNPVSVKGEEVVVFIASTFNFLQSSQVLRFTPAPTGKDGQSDLISITKRFGLPLYTLFLPSQAFVEMKNEADAQKLVDYYSSNTLRMNGQVIKVAFSAEYNSLMRVSLAKKYQEESSTRKRSKSRSPQSERKDSRQYKRRRSREREEKDKEIKRENERRTRSSSSSRTSRSGRSRSREGRYLEKTATPETIQPTKRQSETSEPAPSNPSKPGARLNTAPREEAEETADLSGEESDIEGMEVIGEDGENLMDDEVEALDETEGEEERAADVEEERSKDEEGRSGDEQGRLADEEEEKADVADVAEKDEEEKVKQKDEGEEGMELGDVMQEEKEVEEQARSAEAPEQKVTPELVTDIPSVNGPELQGSAGMAPPQEDESEINEAPDFPLDLENCITLDEIRDEESDDQDQKDDVDEPEVSREGDAEEYHSSSTRVISLTNLPQMVYTDNEFIKIVKGFGTVTRYLLIQKHGEGFLEMSSSAEASRAAQELTSKAFEFHGSVLTVQLSDKYERLTDGTTVQSDVSSDEDREEHRTSGSRSSGQSNASESEDCVNQSTAKEESATADSAEDAEARENQACDLVEVQPSPAESIVEPMKPTKPVGAEFVRPVVGYFCNLCKVIYADEDEAKTEHCSSLSHYQKYKEHTGKDPLAS
ncbi:matrin 3-like 1.1 isoform X2 [Lampris incognitus]|nr:matrin 3-like 1.1 isoform X2 [Lampris incognitus]